MKTKKNKITVKSKCYNFPEEKYNSYCDPLFKNVFYTNIPILQQSEIVISSLIIKLLKIQEENRIKL